MASLTTTVFVEQPLAKPVGRLISLIGIIKIILIRILFMMMMIVWYYESGTYASTKICLFCNRTETASTWNGWSENENMLLPAQVTLSLVATGMTTSHSITNVLICPLKHATADSFDFLHLLHPAATEQTRRFVLEIFQKTNESFYLLSQSSAIYAWDLLHFQHTFRARHYNMEVIYIKIFHKIIITEILWNGPGSVPAGPTL